MKEIVTIFWVFILGFVVSYIGGALSGGTFDVQTTAIVSLIVGVIITFVPKVLPKTEEDKK